MENQSGHLSQPKTAAPKLHEDTTGAVPMRHRNRLGVTNLQDNPQGVGAVPKTNELANQGKKNW